MDHYLSPEQVSQHLVVAQQTLANWRNLGKGPSYVKYGKLVRYPESAVVAWLDAHTALAGSAKSA